MAKNITLLGASYSNVPAVELPQTGGGTAKFTDTSPTTATDSDVASGKIYFKADGSQSTGTASGGSSWTLLHQEDIVVSTTTTSASTTKTITGISSTWDKSSIIYVRVRDKAGPRAGYFYGSDAFFMNHTAANQGLSALTTAGRLIFRYSSSSQWGQYVGQNATGYGVYGYSIASSGAVTIQQRYSSTYSLTINGTYRVQIYKLTYPDGKSPFNSGALT